jgi:hypothetical protein
MLGRGDVRGTAGFYPVLIIAIGGLTVLGFALVGLGTIRMMSQSGPPTAGTGALEPACAGYTCAPLLVPVVLVATVAVLMGASWLARGTAK